MTPTATLRRSGRGRTNANGMGEEEVETVTQVSFATLTYSDTMCFVPPPFIVKQIFDGVSNNPLELILAVKAVAIDFNNTHTSVGGFENVDATIQAKQFSLWAFVVYKDYIEETSFDIDPDNEELQKHCNERHTKCIMPSLTSAASVPANLSDQISILK
jgi:hypothetical protein